MWTVVYIAPSRSIAEMMRQALEQEGLLASLRPAGMPPAHNGAQFEILVPESEAEEAHEVLSNTLGR